MEYSDLVIEHFRNPRNVGVIEDADGVGKEGNPVCGDLMEMYLKIEGDRIVDIKFRTFGCGAAIATSSITTEMIKGKTIDEALALTRNKVAKALGGLPQHKMHCSNLAADALHRALEDYFSRHPEARPEGWQPKRKPIWSEDGHAEDADAAVGEEG
ncbi:MAG: Fe-S cluster assembly scaffold protein NifU [Chloroflexi bacterium]|nr:Fe-S cluster assembly scaffold protein NifU [Chloroflexota bacterium]